MAPARPGSPLAMLADPGVAAAQRDQLRRRGSPLTMFASLVRPGAVDIASAETPIPLPIPADPAASPSPSPAPSSAQIPDIVRERLAQKTSAPAEPKPIGTSTGTKVAAALSGLGSFLGGKSFDTDFWTGVAERERDRTREAQTNAEKASLKDPSSAASRAAQKRWGSFLKAAGWSDEELAGMSAEDLSSMSIGNVSSFLHQSSTKKKELEDRRAAEQAKLEEQRKYDEQKAEQKRFEDQAQWEARNKVTSAQEDRRALIAAQDRKAAQDLEDEREDAKAKAGAKRDYELKLAQSGTPRVRTILSRLRSNIAKAKESNKGDIFVGEDEVLRRGPKQGWAAMAPTARAIMEDVQALQNAQLREMGGQSITLSEMPRIAGEFGTDILSGEADLERYLARVTEEVDALEQTYQRAYEQGQLGTPASSAPARSARPQGAPQRRGLLELPDGSKVKDSPEARQKLKGAGVTFKEL